MKFLHAHVRKKYKFKENTHGKTDLEEILCQQSTGAEDTEELSSTEEDHTTLSNIGDTANLSQSSGVLDVNAQEFVPSNLTVSDVLPIPSKDLEIICLKI